MMQRTVEKDRCLERFVHDIGHN